METREVQEKRRTVSFAASAEGTKVVFSENYKYYHFRNDGGGTVYVSAYSDVGEGVDGTKSIADGGCGYVFSCDDHVFVKGAAKVTVEASNLPDCPFKSAQRGGDITAKGNPVQLDGLQGGVPFSEIVVSGKNLIGIAQAKAIIGDSTSGYSVINNASSRTIIQKLQPNTTYHIKKYDSGNRFRIVMFSNEPTVNADITAKQLINDSSGITKEYTFTTGIDHLWMAFTTHYATSGDAVEPIVQLEYGDTATAYEPPITGQEVTLDANGTEYTITPDNNPYTVPNDIRQQYGLNTISVSAGTLSVTGVRKNAALKRVWNEIDDIKTAIIVSNGENE